MFKTYKTFENGEKELTECTKLEVSILAVSDWAFEIESLNLETHGDEFAKKRTALPGKALAGAVTYDSLLSLDS